MVFIGGPKQVGKTRVGSLIVMSNIAGEIQISPKTVKKWLDVLERMYLVFAVRPYTKNLPRAVINPPKYFFMIMGMSWGMKVLFLKILWTPSF